MEIQKTKPSHITQSLSNKTKSVFLFIPRSSCQLLLGAVIDWAAETNAVPGHG